jgi:PKD repeat protein
LFLSISSSPIEAQSSHIFDQEPAKKPNVSTVQLDGMVQEWTREIRTRRTRALKLARERGWLIEKTFPSGKIIALQYLDEQGRPVYYTTFNRGAAETISTDDVWPGGPSSLSLTGSGHPFLGIWDGGGVDLDHDEFDPGRVSQEDSPGGESDHATHVAGTMIARGADPAAKGMAFEGELRAYDFYFDLTEMALETSNGLLVSNHSYGQITGWFDGDAGCGEPWTWYGDTTVSTVEDNDFGRYSSLTRRWDQLAKASPYYVMTKAAGNDRQTAPGGQPTSHCVYDNSSDTWVTSTTVRDKDGGSNGYDSLPDDGTAKNVLVVGAIEEIAGGYSSPADVTMSSFSSWGPTDDGRIKPDVVAKGVNTYSSETGNSYGTKNGTSMAAPNVSGSVALLQEHFINVFSDTPLSSTIRGLVAHTADEAGNDGPDYKHGWGVMNTRDAGELISRDANSSTKPLIRERLVKENSQLEGIVHVEDTGEPLKMTIAWTDSAPQNPQPANELDPTETMLVNNLDLRLIAGDGTVRKPWVLNPASPSSPATTGDNNRDNIEQVYVQNPADTYTVRITMENDIAGNQSQWVSILSHNVSGNSSPDANFTVQEDTPSVDEVLHFQNNSTDTDGRIDSYQWSFGDGDKSSVENPTHRYNTPGTYTVQLTITDDGGAMDTVTKTLAVNELPRVNFSFNPDTPLVDETVTFNSSASDSDGTIETYDWSFGDGDNSSSPNPTHRYLTSDTYTVHLTVKDNDGETNHIQKSLYVNYSPRVDFTYSPDTASVNEVLNFTNLSSDTDGHITSYKWSFGDGDSSVLSNPQHSYSSYGNFSVQLLVRDNRGATMAVTRTLLVNQPPLARFDYSPNVPSINETTNFTDQSADSDGSIQRYEWSFGDGETSSDPTPSHSYDTSDTFDIRLVVTDDAGETDVFRRSIHVNQDPRVDFTYSPTSPRAGQTITFEANATDPDGSIQRYEWNFDDGDTSELTNPEHIFETHNEYDVSLLVQDNNGDTAEKTIMISTLGPEETELTSDFINQSTAGTIKTFASEKNFGVMFISAAAGNWKSSYSQDPAFDPSSGQYVAVDNPNMTRAELSVFTRSGEKIIQKSVSGSQSRIKWTGRNFSRRIVQNGVYILRVEVTTQTGSGRTVTKVKSFPIMVLK